MRMEAKQLDFDAPLLSARKFAYSIQSSPLGVRILPPSDADKRKNMPSGMVPFLWEQSAGRRKEEEGLAGYPVSAAEKTAENEEDDEDFFTDAASCFMSCSTSGDIPNLGKLSLDNRLRDFVMGRFLPAAHAMASLSPHRRTSPKTPAIGGENECNSEDAETGENENKEEEAAAGDNQGTKIIPLPPPLPESPSDSWLRRTLSVAGSKGITVIPFLSVQPGRIKKAAGPSSRGPVVGKLEQEGVSVISSSVG